MLLQVQGASAYCYTGGRAFEAGLPTAVFIHGAQNDHSVWLLQSRYFAQHGYNVLALDLPGHGRSQGPTRTSVEALAAWLMAVLDAAGVQRAMLVGHSMGALVALEATAQAPPRVSRLALLGVAYPMKVAETLLQTARDDETAAIDMVNLWSHSALARQTGYPAPGCDTVGVARQLMLRLSQINPHQLLYTDLYACNSYANGAAAAQLVACPTLFIAGARDQMTPAKAARQLTAAIPHGRTVQLDCGHALMAERPDGVLDALFDFATIHAHQ